ncbi:MAG: hypothetical protein GY719_27520 [bacterium]|nr:hypothetical protein [bacterium]
MKRTFVFIMLMIPTLAAVSVQAQSVPGDASEKAKILGVERYQYNREAKVIEIELIGSDGQALDASMRLEFDTPEGLLVQYSGEKGPLTITWSPMLPNPKIRIEDPTSGIAVHRRFDPDNRVWLRETSERDGAEKLLSSRSRGFEIAMTTLDDALSNFGLNMHFSNLPTEAPTPPEKVGGCSQECPSACTGSWYRGAALAATASSCCYQATNNVNNRCTQAGCFCFGCCQILSCDSVCALGDYFCSCGVSGKGCGPDPFCDGDWPPQCI